MSTEKIRKLRLFQPNQYISLDYQKQEAVRFAISEGAGAGEVRMSVPGEEDRSVSFEAFPVEKNEPLRLELDAFADSVRSRRQPQVSGAEATRAVAVCLAILGKIEEHGQQVAETLASWRETGRQPLSPL